MPVFHRFESGNTFKVAATKATGKPIKPTEPKSLKKYPNVHQPKSKAPVTLPSLNRGKPA